MDRRGRVQLHEFCVIPFRRGPAGLEFCLVSNISDGRWEFPRAAIDPDLPPAHRIAELADAVGLRGRAFDGEPLGEFHSARAERARVVTAYLLEVRGVSDTWPLQNDVRRRWCYPEEARVRIRSKPLRHLIDVALRSAIVRNELGAPTAG